ncbi:PREDICTED: uncharacterized protein LOC106104086 [Papilio polytes]|uniref:uncharacterized protein LOC106104086 n=1 Tax=Papilio polytes TaxID=76194 RepID=UPI000675D1B9|nr:PREDICTED: uncharacterized protein LOC106104086 [Papilio polytes]
MAAKSPTGSVRSREVIGVEQFSQRREVFDKQEGAFVPLPAPASPPPVYRQVDPIVTSNHGKTTANFKRNAPAYSSMRESRSEDRNHFEFRTRKYSDNFTSELNQSDDVDYRTSMTERTRRLSKLRRDFLNSNLHDPSESPQFQRAGVRASMPTKSSTVVKYKIESPNLFKFPFAEPYSTPTPVRRVVVDLGSPEVNGKENEDPEAKTRHQSLPDHGVSSKVDHQKLFEELVKRYSPQRKPIDWSIPPTRPRVVASVPKSISSGTDSVDSDDKKTQDKDDKVNGAENDDVFENKKVDSEKEDNKKEPNDVQENNTKVIQNGPEVILEANEVFKDTLIKNQLENNNESKTSLSELEEKNDRVPELPPLQRQISRESHKKQTPNNDLTIPKLIEKISVEGDNLEQKTTKGKKVKRKRSFLDKLLGRNKEK